MKHINILLIFILMIASIDVASAQPSVVDSKIIWSENNFFGFIWGDHIEEITYSDGYVKNIMHRSRLLPGEITDVPRITVSQGSSNIPVKFTLQGMRCSLTSYSNHIVDFYVGTVGSSAPIAHQAMGIITCEQFKSYTVNVPAGNLLVNTGNFDLMMEETSYNAAATTFVTETRIFNVVVSPSVTPPPPPPPSTGKITITSTPTGASIRVDTQYMGVTPINVNIPTGDYRIEASKTGYQTQSRTQSVYAGYQVEMSFTLTPISTPTPTYTPPPTITTPVYTPPPGIQKCSDNTLYGQCSSQKPLFCYYGTLVDKASACGCPSGQTPSGDSCIAPVVTTPSPTETSVIILETPTATTTQISTQYQCSNGDFVYDSADCPQSTPGFEAVFAITGLFITTWLILRKHET